MEPGEYATLFALEERFWWYRGLHRLVSDRVAEALGPGEHRPRILDAGCGTGALLQSLESRGQSFGIDQSPLALFEAGKRGALRLSRASVTSLPFRSQSFDLIVSLDVLYHRAVASDLVALREFRRCLRPGGSVVLNLPAFESLRSSHDVAIHTARRYRRKGLERLLHDADLEVERITYWNSLLFPGLALLRRLRRPRLDPTASPGDSVAATSDVRALPSAVNSVLQGILELERRWLRHRNLPFGLSLLAVARRPSEDP